MHHDSPDEVQPSYEGLAPRIADHDLRGVDLSREVSLNCPADDVDAWVTELQIEVVDA